MTLRWTLGLLALAGCRGPSEEQIVGTGLIGAVFFAITSWLLLTGVARVWERLHTGAWPEPQSKAGGLALIGAHLGLSLLALVSAEQVRDVGLVGIIWGCAAANHLAWSVIFWRFGGRLRPVVAVALASVPSLLIGLPGGLGNEGFAIAALLQWLWGGFLGAAPAIIILLVWLEGWLRRGKPIESA